MSVRIIYWKLPELDHYMLRLAASPFFMSLSVILLALLLNRLLVLFSLLSTGASNLGMLLQLLTNLIPHYLGLAIPAAFCTSIFATIQQLLQYNELDSIMSSGISLTGTRRGKVNAYRISRVSTPSTC